MEIYNFDYWIKNGSFPLLSFLFRGDLLGTTVGSKTDEFEMSSTWTVSAGFNSHISLNFFFLHLVTNFYD